MAMGPIGFYNFAAIVFLFVAPATRRQFVEILEAHG